MGRRDSNDKQWASIKKAVRERDKNTDRILRILPYKDAIRLRQIGKTMSNVLDTCHIFPVSVYPELCYVIDNLILMNRASHTWIDSSRNPVTGEPMSLEETMTWWQNIAGPDQWKRLMQRKEEINVERYTKYYKQ